MQGLFACTGYQRTREVTELIRWWPPILALACCAVLPAKGEGENDLDSEPLSFRRGVGVRSSGQYGEIEPLPRSEERLGARSRPTGRPIDSRGSKELGLWLLLGLRGGG